GAGRAASARTAAAVAPTRARRGGARTAARRIAAARPCPRPPRPRAPRAWPPADDIDRHTPPVVCDRMRPDLLAAPLDELLAAARQVRDHTHGTRVTYSPKVFIPLTMLCRDRCGYCTFAQPPARLESPYLTPDQVLAI